MAFLDEDEAFDQPAPRRPGGGDSRPYLARRLIALGAGVLIIILLVLAVRGCLNARKERSFENYNRDLYAIATEAQQLSDEFFQRLEDPPADLNPVTLEAQVSADRGTAEGLLDRVENLDTPDELSGAQEELELAFELRRDGIANIAEQVSAATGDEGREEAISRIATDMRFFLASDVLYNRARADINATLDAEEIPVAEDERLPVGRFLPDDPVWLDTTELISIFSGLAGEAAPDRGGVHGLALLESSINGTVLTAGGLTTIAGGCPCELEVQAQNQGDSTESDVPVTYELSGAVDASEGEGTIDQIQAGDTETATIRIRPDPATGEELALEVTVTPVIGEEIEDNNTATYTVIFE